MLPHIQQFFLSLQKPSVCPECLVKHAPNVPHDKNSLYYQCTFYSQQGRWPTWEDATAHCSQEVKMAWSLAFPNLN